MSEEHPVVGASGRDPLLGTVLGERYRIERKLGEGGMGAVYLARHVILEKIVALKILHDEYARRRELVERFLHEAKAASRIRHEHVIDITDFGETATKNVFFAMEYLDGHDLAGELNRAPMPWPRIKSIVLQICAALQAAHEAGVIHRDLKPENIYLIERLGNPDYVKVLDFGVAKLTEIEEGRERRLTRTGMVFGTPEYMSPEQARGDKPDTRVDIYALGCILFEMVTGDVPFRAENFMGVLTKHLFDPQPLLSERTTRRDYPPGLQEVITQALAKDRSLRFASMNELAVAVDTLDGGESYLTRRVATERPRDKEPRPPAPALAETPPVPVATPPVALVRPAVADEPELELDPGLAKKSRAGLVAAAAIVLLAAVAGAVWMSRTPPEPAPAKAAPAPVVTPPPPTPTPVETVAPVEPPKAVDTEPPKPVETPTPPPAPPKTVEAPVRRPIVHRAQPPAPSRKTPPPAVDTSTPPPPPPPAKVEPKSDLKDPFGGK